MLLTEGQDAILANEGHLLVTGGPGSGKTTVSILKAATVTQEELSAGQRVLFLSFARATVARVVQAIRSEHALDRQVRKRIEIETYHSFFWFLIRCYGYLIGLPRRVVLLAPPEEAIALSSLRSEFGADRSLSAEELAEKRACENTERRRLALEEGKICFDLFAIFAAEILTRCQRVRTLVGLRYPTIILDEFQDTSAGQWAVVEALGETSRLIALADPEQRIYDWIGADPERLDHFGDAFDPTVVDLSGDNHRSNGTDILAFGNAVLTGDYKDEPYVGVEVITYPPNENQAYTALLTTIYAARTRLIDAAIPDWSIAVLVPTKLLTRLVSDQLRDPPGNLTKVSHSAVVEMDGAILGAEIIAILLQRDEGLLFELVPAMCDFYQGRGGDSPSQTSLREADHLSAALDDFRERVEAGGTIRGNSRLVRTLQSIEAANAVTLTGDPGDDWRAIRGALEEGPCPRLKLVADDVRNLRLLGRGMELRQALAQLWREYGDYRGARQVVHTAFEREHFSVNRTTERGVVVMNMHKAKGKQFDEVILFEGWPVGPVGGFYANSNRIVRSNLQANNDEQSRQNFRVSVTRGRRRTTILTPSIDPCILL